MRQSYIIILLFVIILFELIRILLRKKRVHFVSRAYIYNIIDNALYFKKMNKNDLTARKAETIDQYIHLYKVSIQDFTYDEKEYLSRCVAMIDKKLQWTKHFNELPWKFCKVDSSIENGYPHTHADVIVVSPLFFNNTVSRNLETLIHEQIHIYQRKYTYLTEKYINSIGFQKTDISLQKEIAGKVRSNPDISNLYCYGNYIPLEIYTSDSPLSIGQTITKLYDTINETLIDYDESKVSIPSFISQKEHPYEIMAVVVADFLSSQRYRHKIVDITRDWVLTSL